ncbi:metallophosphoesterase [Desulfosarcina sp. OttesenSCG-928-G10]|nr:metallophosphoesterase [Desulfosarcina sp. OttesenSCG-928-G10]MDL2321785.1 metallophosphoesterase [Desulfosarcina sp. OttesenSCG-928-B08]
MSFQLYSMIIGLVLFLYLFLRLFFSLPLQRPVKLAGGMVLLLVSQQYFFFRLFFGGISSPDLPRPVLMALGWIFIAMLFAFFLLFVHDLGVLVLRAIRFFGPSVSFPLSDWQRLTGLCALALVISGYGIWQGVRVPDVRVQEVRLSRLPEELDGLKVVQLTDLHISDLLTRPRAEAIVRKTNALDPDLILLTGDMVDGPVARRQDDVAPLAHLKARHGIFSCLGNHEYYAGLPEWEPVFKQLGLNILQNSHQTLAIRNRPLVIAGITDPAAARSGQPQPDIMAALSGAPSDAVTLVMAHQPGTARASAAAGADLQLSGHTHGGHIIGLGPLIKPRNDGFLRGWYTVGSMKLYVSPGAGLWPGFSVRIGVPAEITCLVLRTGK